MYLLLGITGVVLFTVLFCLGLMRLYQIHVLAEKRRLTAAVADLQIECHLFIALLHRYRVVTVSQLSKELWHSSPGLTAKQIVTITEWAFVYRYCTRFITRTDSVYYSTSAGDEWLRQSTRVSDCSSA